MKIEIQIELDKDSQELLQTTLNKVADNLAGFMNMFEKFNVKSEDVEHESVSVKADDINTKSESGAASEKKRANSAKDRAKNSSKIEEVKQEESKLLGKEIEHQSKKAKKTTSSKIPASKNITGRKKNKTAVGTVLNAIKKRGSINVDDLKKETGFSSRKVADAVYRLKKTGKIDKTDTGHYIPIG